MIFFLIVIEVITHCVMYNKATCIVRPVLKLDFALSLSFGYHEIMYLPLGVNTKKTVCF